ncbi:uncharacterized protein SOCG_04607 [Schizosaccharomyces octosporus yFS286]|uniref:Uncharacterized protein n=1 Tax=Schizosaccharomyces octosporus (strain yFS286) TaxID=483514 RepID=S9RB48_SCHOY|nr:uncharacterized protein SOCG_04607 [Schizosaccharomyces octosporus yFS286]EPX75365.1 hypothetical protein SOCG_04607 [Schizosaccharomyces octosporus yFS286]
MKQSIVSLSSKRGLAPRPKTAQVFRQRVVLANGASYTINTTLPRPYMVSIKDITNMPLNNPDSHALSSIGGQESRRSKFEQRYEGL